VREVRVNVAVRELLEAAYVDHVLDCIRRAQLDPGALVLEISDEDLADAPTAAMDSLVRLRSHGLHVCLDHFGDGRRSLGNLRRTAIDRLKLGPGFVTAVVEGADDRVVARSMLDLGHALGMQVTAAGVETRSQRTELVRMGCTHGQGNLWAPPLPPGGVLDALLERV
jgi:EAL domain-containing protein (putative c-di-GMP-specific phosphodiesterase class I)